MEHSLDSLPHVQRRLRRNESGLCADIVQPESIDFQFLCRNDRRWEAELYICAGEDENKSVEQRHSGVARTPLQLAAESGCLNVVYLLLERHAEVEAEDRLGRRPLHLAAQKGHTDVCIALVDSGEADVHAVDHDGNTPLHLAAKANKAQTVHQLASIEEHQIREVLSGRLHPGMDREVPLMFSDRFAAMQKQKLYDNERRHFRKDWLYECALQCYDDHLPPETQKLVTRPVLSAVEGVLRSLDPDPDGGYLKTEKLDGIAVETWVPCVTLPMHLVELLKYAFKYTSLQSRNQLGRTALHEACFANRADSHFEVIRILVDEHVQSLHAVDDHGSDARHLVLDPRGRPDSPTGHRFREDIIDDTRDDLLDDYADAVKAIEAARSAERQREALEDACRRGTELSHEHWGLLKDMSLVKRSLAGVDEFEDSDTKNRFYRWRDVKAEAERLDNEEDQEITCGAASFDRLRLPMTWVFDAGTRRRTPFGSRNSR